MGIKMNYSELCTLTKDLMKEIWNDTVDIPIEISSRMTSTFGYFMVTRERFGGKTTAKKLNFAERMFNGDYNLLTIVDVIKHELTHYKLFKDGNSGYHDGNWQFENELIRIGSHSTRVLTNPGEHHKGVCKHCGATVITGSEKKVKNKCNTSKYFTKCCRAQIVYGGSEYIIDDCKERMALESCFRFDNLEAVKKFLGKSKIKEFTPIAKPTVDVASTPIRKAASNPAPTPMGDLKIEDIVKPGPKGVTRAQVHPAIVAAIDEKAEAKLKLIKSTYPEFFSQVMNYISKTRVTYVQSLGL